MAEGRREWTIGICPTSGDPHTCTCDQGNRWNEEHGWFDPFVCPEIEVLVREVGVSPEEEQGEGYPLAFAREFTDEEREALVGYLSLVEHWEGWEAEKNTLYGEATEMLRGAINRLVAVLRVDSGG